MIRKNNHKEPKVQILIRIPKTTYDELKRESTFKRLSMTEIACDALKEYFHPFDKENHEKHSKIQLARLMRDSIGINNKLDLLLIVFEEYIKTFYYHTQNVTFEDEQAKIATAARVLDGRQKFIERILTSAINNKPNILSELGILRGNKENVAEPAG